MIHSPDVINRIRELLSLSGVPQGDVLEEMTDHYLSDIERQIDLNINHQVAIRSTYQKIAKTDLRNLQNHKRPNLLLVLTSVFLLAITVYVYQHQFYASVPESEEVSEGITEELATVELAPEGWPLKESKAITSNFGLRKHPVLRTIRHHDGIDIKAKIGTPILATGDAIVKETGFNKYAGKFIVLEHNCRYSTRYYHLSSIDVQENDSVTKGSIIGKVGNSGLSSSPHLHYEIMDEDAHIDPLECARA